MATNIARYEIEGGTHWGVVSASGISPLDGVYPTTTALIEQGEADWRAASGKAASVPMISVKFLSPVTAPCRVYCQGANYRQHMIESGMDPDAKPFNMFFTKSDASISPARGSVQRPKHVMLLDYEIELALVFRRPISSSVAVTQDRRHDRERSQRTGRPASADAILQGQELSWILPDRSLADGSWARRIRLPRPARITTLRKRFPSSARYDKESRVQARRNDFRIVDFRKRQTG